MVLGDAGLTRIEWGARKVAPDTIGHDDESRRGLTPAGAALDHDYASSSVLLAQGSHLDGDGFQPGEGARPDMLDLGDDAGSDHIHPATAVGGAAGASQQPGHGALFGLPGAVRHGRERSKSPQERSQGVSRRAERGWRTPKALVQCEGSFCCSGTSRAAAGVTR